jgi:predicted SnoaL-like aldol condensation-catalyzing enzyme
MSTEEDNKAIVFRIADGKIAEHWHVADMLGMMRQLGAMPTAGQLP